MERVLLLYKSDPAQLPPLLTVASVLGALGAQVEVAGVGIGLTAREALEDRGIRVTELMASEPESKPAHYWKFFRRAWRLIDDRPAGTLLWIGSADTAFALGPPLWRRRHILQVHELYDGFLRYRLILPAYLRHATAVVVPEPSRAAILRCWYQLPSTPYVLPNKPLVSERARNLPIRDPRACNALRAISPESRIVLYQGPMDLQERNLLGVARAVYEMGPPWQLVAMGRDANSVRTFQRSCPSMVYIPHVPAPAHLDITSHAFAGVVTYSYRSLNNVFCAPNKIWEFAAFGVPLLCNALPGLETHLREFHAGVSVDCDDCAAIKAGLHTLAADYTTYAAGSRALFDSVDLKRIIETTIRDTFGRRSSPREEAAAVLTRDSTAEACSK
jgi:hypothetical protein